MKREETIAIEKVLQMSLFGSNPKLARWYGTKEVTISFPRNGNGREIVDFMSYDPKKGVIRCYEIKVTMQDFRSKAKKSWYGNYNYLAISDDLYRQQSSDAWKDSVPESVGIIVVNTDTYDKQTVKKAVKQDISAEQTDTLKDSLIRTLFYQSQKRKE